MAKDKPLFPAIIIGGGPAGLATSLTLSARGVHHCIVDAKLRARHKAGEAIPPNAKPLLRQLGIDQLLTHKSHIAYYGNKASWGDDELRQEEFISDVHGNGYLLDRLLFETQLRDLVASPFCTKLWGNKLHSVKDEGQVLKLLVESKTDSYELECQYAIDATGRKASLCRQLGVLKTSLDDQFALTIQVPVSSPLEQQIYIEATEHGWWYAAPFGQEDMNLMFFTSQELIPAKAELTAFLYSQLKCTKFIRTMTDSFNLLSEDISIMPAGTSCLDVPYGDNWLAVGDAAYSYDPISSYGITSGLAAGYYAGHALADTLSGKEGGFEVYRYLMENAFQAYLDKLQAHYALEQRWPESRYWKSKLANIEYQHS